MLADIYRSVLDIQTRGMLLRSVSRQSNLRLFLGIMLYLFGPCDAQKMMCSSGLCGPGQLLDSEDRCVSCPPDTYLLAWQHSCRTCRPCTTPSRHNHEVILRNCTSVSDTNISCDPGYFRTAYGVGEQDCLKCTICQIGTTILKCGTFSDAVCAKAKTPAKQPMPDGESLKPKSPPFYVKAFLGSFGAVFVVFISYLRLSESVSMSYTLMKS